MRSIFWVITIPISLLLVSFSLYTPHESVVKADIECDCDNMALRGITTCSFDDGGYIKTCTKADNTCNCITMSKLLSKPRIVAEVIQEDPCQPMPTGGCMPSDDLFRRLGEHFLTLPPNEIPSQPVFIESRVIDEPIREVTVGNEFEIVKAQVIEALGFEPSEATMMLLESDFEQNRAAR